MRPELKMRAWCIEEKMYAKRILTINFPQDCSDPEEAIELELPVDEKPFLTCSFDNVIFEQCTGLKDKNGVLIYEGDEITYSDDGLGKSKRIILFHDGGFNLQSLNLRFWEITSNTHEPKTLEGETK